MQRKESDKDKNQKPARKFKFFLGSRERHILIDCDFEAGNIDLVRQISEFQYRLASVYDGTNTNHRVNSKSWFYFSVTGFPRKTKGRFFITKVQTLSSIFYSKYKNSYRPVYRVGEEGEWMRLPTEAELVMRENSELQCVFDYTFKDESEKVYFAFCYPYTYADYSKYMLSLNDFILHDDFYFYKQILTQSPEGRDLHLLTITSYDHQDKLNEHEQLFDQMLFPEKARPLRFKKPVVFVSARVHPGETPASYAMKGVIDFLTSTSDLRANLLRKMFVFMIVPMINVDGVYHGHFRMDTEGRNLNRYYIKPNPTKQPAIYAIKRLAEHLTTENRLSFYFDLHAHNAKKGCFIYGNAINDFVEQVQSQVFCKLISLNNKGFEYNYCNFSQKHMNAKDRGDELTKEGCGRVVMYRLAKIIHSYSVQCGLVSANTLNDIPSPINQNFELGDKGFTQDECQDNNSPIYHKNGHDTALFTQKMYENLGKNIMVSILDAFDKNPYNRVYNSKYKSLEMLRRLTAFEIFHSAERFRMFEKFVFGKVKNINQLIRDVLNTKLHYKKLYNFYFFDDPQLKGVEWPDNVPGLAKPKTESPPKMRKFRSVESASDYSIMFMKALMSTSENSTLQAKQEDIEQPLDNASKSSETEDFDAEKDLFGEACETIRLNQIAEDEGESGWQFQKQRARRTSFSQENQQINKSELNLPNSHAEISIRLCFDIDPTSSIKKKESPSVRVRRLMRQDFGTGTTRSEKQISEKRSPNPLPSSTPNIQLDEEPHGGSEIKKSIYDSIKQQINEQLKREQFKEMRRRNNRIEFEPRKMCSPVKIHKERIKSWTVKRDESARSNSKNKLHLPSLGAQMCVISTSTKTFLKKN